MRGLILGFGIIWLFFFLAFFLVPLWFWIKHIVRLSKREDKTNMWICLAIGLFFSPLVGWIVGHFLGKDEESGDKENRERY